MAESISLISGVFGLIIPIIPLLRTTERKINTLDGIGSGSSLTDNLKTQLRICSLKLETWAKTWLYGDMQASTAYGEYLWGPEGQNQIEHLLTTISAESEKLKELVRQLEVISKWESTPRLKRLFQKRTSAYMSPGIRTSRLSTSIAVLNESIESLYQVSDACFREKHKSLKQNLVLRKDTTMALQRISATRRDSQSLDLFCRDLPSQVRVYLALETFQVDIDSESDHSLRLRYVLTYQHESKDHPREIISISEFRSYEERSSSQPLENVLEVSNNGKFLKLLVENRRDRHNLVSRGYSICQLKESASHLPEELEDLSTLLSTERQFDSNRISLAAKFGLAFNIAKCGLFLLGTFWLSDLNTSKFRRARTAEQKDQYFLLAPSLLTGHLHSLTETFSATKNQIAHIGLILVDIALGIQSKEQSKEKSKEQPEQSELSLDTIERVYRSMGQHYGDAVSSCFAPAQFESPLPATDGSTSRDTQALIDNTIAPYYYKVYIP
ncbi:hypothetical protein GGR54DRAFT_265221 [Hypoxylon sp. NC1633]|nr:hypothetical protein GGR54DRAFT_265221 [Hypoxylon sp. NC1633]